MKIINLIYKGTIFMKIMPSTFFSEIKGQYGRFRGQLTRQSGHKKMHKMIQRR